MLLVGLALSCGSRGGEAELKATIARYDELLRDAYERQDMRFMGEAATVEQARKLYVHMAALGEGNLRLSSTLRDLQVLGIEHPAPDAARVETREVWDYTHYRIATGQKYAEERAFVYRMAYLLRRQPGGRWLVADVNVIAAQPGETVIPWPRTDGPAGVGGGHAPAAGGQPK